MLIDITLPISEKMWKEAKESKNAALEGHLGTHFDTMDQEFPLDYTKREGILFDVSAVEDREIGLGDIELSMVEGEMFVAFYTGYNERIAYGEGGYFKEHPQLSKDLIYALIERGVSIIGIDFAGVRRGAEHTPMDQYCADRGTFIIENLWDLKALPERFIAHTYPLRSKQLTGLPCRVIAEI